MSESMEAFKHLGWLGHGSYGDVQLCQVSTAAAKTLLGEDIYEASAQQFVALKTWRAAHHDHKIMRIALREVTVLNGLSHCNIIKLRRAFRTPSGRVCMVFDYGGSSAQQVLEDRYPLGFPGPQLKRLAFQLLQALKYLHSRKVLHRDVKPANVLLDSAGVLRLCDFGFARFTCEEAAIAAKADLRAAASSDRLTPYVVTRWYRAPEVLLGMPYGPGADVWSFGATLAELATGEPLLPGDSSLDQLARIMRATGPLNPHMATCLSRDLRTPLTSLLANHAAQKGPNGLLRRTLGARLSPALLDLVEACLQPDPKDRPTAEQLLRLPYFLDAPRLFAGSALEAHYAKDPVYAAMRSPAAALQQATEAAAAAAAAVVSGADGSAGCLAQRPAADTTDAGRAACKAMDAAAATTAAASMAHHRRYDYAPPQQERAAERHHRHLAARAHAGRAAGDRSMAASSDDTSTSGGSGGSGGSVNATTAPPAHTTSGLSSITMSSSNADCAPPSSMMMRTRTSCSGMTTTTTQGNSGRDTSNAPSCSLDGNTATSAVMAAAAAAVVAATAAGCGGGSCTVGAEAAAAEVCSRTELAQGSDDAARRSMGLHKRQASSGNDDVRDEKGPAPLQPKLPEATATEVPAEEVWRGDANKSRRLASTILPPDTEMTIRTSSLAQDAVAAAATAAAATTAKNVVQPTPEGKSGATDYHACHTHEVSTRAAAAASAFVIAAGRAVAAAAGTAGAAAAVNSINVVVSPVAAAEGTGSNNSSAPISSHTPGPIMQTDAHAGYVASPSRLCKHGYVATESPFVSAAAPVLDTGLRGLPASTTCTEEQQPTAASASAPLFITLPATFVAAAAPLAGGVPAASNPAAHVRSHGDPAATAATEVAAASAASLQTAAAGVPAAATSSAAVAAMAAAAMAARSRSMYGSSGPRDGAAAAAAHAYRTSTAPNAASGPSGMVLWSHGWSERIDTGSSYGTVCGPAAGPALPAVHRETSHGCYGVGVGASGSAFAVMAAAAALPSGASHGNGHSNGIYNGILTSVANIPTIFQAQVQTLPSSDFPFYSSGHFAGVAVAPSKPPSVATAARAANAAAANACAAMMAGAQPLGSSPGGHADGDDGGVSAQWLDSNPNLRMQRRGSFRQHASFRGSRGGSAMLAAAAAAHHHQQQQLHQQQQQQSMCSSAMLAQVVAASETNPCSTRTAKANVNAHNHNEALDSGCVTTTMSIGGWDSPVPDGHAASADGAGLAVAAMAAAAAGGAAAPPPIRVSGGGLRDIAAAHAAAHGDGGRVSVPPGLANIVCGGCGGVGIALDDPSLSATATAADAVNGRLGGAATRQMLGTAPRLSQRHSAPTEPQGHGGAGDRTTLLWSPSTDSFEQFDSRCRHLQLMGISAHDRVGSCGGGGDIIADGGAALDSAGADAVRNGAGSRLDGWGRTSLWRHDAAVDAAAAASSVAAQVPLQPHVHVLNPQRPPNHHSHQQHQHQYQHHANAHGGMQVGGGGGSSLRAVMAVTAAAVRRASLGPMGPSPRGVPLPLGPVAEEMSMKSSRRSRESTRPLHIGVAGVGSGTQIAASQSVSCALSGALTDLECDSNASNRLSRVQQYAPRSQQSECSGQLPTGRNSTAARAAAPSATPAAPGVPADDDAGSRSVAQAVPTQDGGSGSNSGGSKAAAALSATASIDSASKQRKSLLQRGRRWFQKLLQP